MKPTIPEVLARFAAYHVRVENLAWGSMHIALDDHNVDDDSVRFCIDDAIAKGDVEGEALARILLTMSKTQRLKISRLA